MRNPASAPSKHAPSARPVASSLARGAQGNRPAPAREAEGTARQAHVASLAADSARLRQLRAWQARAAAPAAAQAGATLQRKVTVSRQGEPAVTAAPADLVSAWRGTGHLNAVAATRADEKISLSDYMAVIRDILARNDDVLVHAQATGWAPAPRIGDLAAEVIAGLLSSPEQDGGDVFYDAISEPVGQAASEAGRIDAVLDERVLLPAALMTQLQKMQRAFRAARGRTELPLDEGPITDVENWLEQRRINFCQRLNVLRASVGADLRAEARLGGQLDDWHANHATPGFWAGLARTFGDLSTLEQEWAAFALARQAAQPAPRVFIHKDASVLDRYTEMTLGNYNAGRKSPHDDSRHIHVNGYSDNVLFYNLNGNLYICEHVPWHMDKDMSGQQTGLVQTYSGRIASLGDFVEHMRPAANSFVPIDTWYAQAMAQHFL